VEKRRNRSVSKEHFYFAQAKGKKKKRIRAERRRRKNLKNVFGWAPAGLNGIYSLEKRRSTLTQRQSHPTHLCRKTTRRSGLVAREKVFYFSYFSLYIS